MKAISLLQPWATLVVLGVKTIETRSWSTRYRGPLLIHASTGKAGSIMAVEAPFKRHIPAFNNLPFGAIIGQVTVRDIVKINDLGLPDLIMDRLTMEEKAFGEYSEGRYAWMLEDAVILDPPIAARGTLGLWEYPG